MIKWLSKRKQNFKLLKRELIKISKELEKKDYEYLSNAKDGFEFTKNINGNKLFFYADVSKIKHKEDLFIIIESGGIPTFMGTPGYHFYKKPTGEIYY